MSGAALLPTLDPMKAPASVVVASLLFLASGMFCFVQGSMGAEFFELDAHFTLPTAVAGLFGLLHLYVAIWLLLGENLARCLALWVLALGFLCGWVALWTFVQGHAPFQDFARTLVKILVCTWFLWHLSGPNALAHTRGGEHGEGHAHA